MKTFLLSAAFVVVIAIGGVTLWKVVTGPTKQELAALNAKVEATNAALAQVQKATASEVMTKGLNELADNIKATNTALADIQRTIAAGNVRERLDTLEKNLKAIDASLAGLQKAQQAADVGDKVAALQSEIKAVSGKLADLPQAAALKGVGDKVAALESEIKAVSGKFADLPQAAALKGIADKVAQLGTNVKSTDATLAAIKEGMPKQNLADQIDPLNDKIKSLTDTLAEIQKSTSFDGVKTQLAALNTKLESTNKTVDGDQETTRALKTAIADLKEATKPQPKEAVVFYLHMPNEENLPQKVASVQPLDIQFEKIGSTDDQGQAALIIPKVKALVEGRKDCTIAVAGYADTVGGDQVNLKISQKRAKNIAQKIKAAFDGSDVKVDEAAWGERRLKAWTPDGTADENNRRVDIAVNCKG